VLDEQEPQILQGPTVLPLRVLPDGDYIVFGGLLVGGPVRLDRDRDGTPRVALVGVETVRRTVALSSESLASRPCLPLGPAWAWGVEPLTAMLGEMSQGLDLPSPQLGLRCTQGGMADGVVLPRCCRPAPLEGQNRS
jgi:hypothetical protein